MPPVAPSATEDVWRGQPTCLFPRFFSCRHLPPGLSFLSLRHLTFPLTSSSSLTTHKPHLNLQVGEAATDIRAERFI
jgi:hypothetical protein